MKTKEYHRLDNLINIGCTASWRKLLYVQGDLVVYEGTLDSRDRVKFVDISTDFGRFFLIDYHHSNQGNGYRPLNFSVRANMAPKSLLDLYALIRDDVAKTPKKDQNAENEVRPEKPSIPFKKRFIKRVSPKKIEEIVETVGV